MSLARYKTPYKTKACLSKRSGDIVQLVERMLCMHEVIGSIPIISNGETAFLFNIIAYMNALVSPYSLFFHHLNDSTICKQSKSLCGAYALHKATFATQIKAALLIPNIEHVKNKLEITTLKPLVHKVNRRLALQEKISLSAQIKSKRGVLVDHESRTRTTIKRNHKKNIGIISVYTSRNNTLLTLSRRQGQLVKGGWASAGSAGFKNSRKSTTYASQAAAKSIALKAKQLGLYYLHVKLKGMGRAKAAVVRLLRRSSLKVLAIRECTPTVHNGCRPPKVRRI